MSGAALLWRDAPDHVRAVGDGLLAVKRAVFAGETLADDLGVLVDEHRGLLAGRVGHLARTANLTSRGEGADVIHRNLFLGPRHGI